MKNKNNKGVTVVELLVVLVVIAILSGLVTVTISVVNNANAQRAAKTLQSAFSNARVQSMSRGKNRGYLHLYQVGNRLVYSCGEGADMQSYSTVCNGIVKVNVGTYAVPTEVYFTDSSAVDARWYFDSAGMVDAGSSSAFNQITFKRGNRYMYVFLHTVTGKTEVGIYYE